MTTLLDKVAQFIARLAPHPVCDGCVADRLELGTPQRANRMVRELVGSGGYERRRDICSLCFNEKMVTRRH